MKLKIKLLALLLVFVLTSTSCIGCFKLLDKNARTDFTSEEKADIADTCGFDLPFVPCTEYTLDRLGEGFLLSVIGVSDANYDNYINNALTENFTFVGERADYYGDVWYDYFRDGWKITVCRTKMFVITEMMNVYLYPASYNIEDVQSNLGAGLPASENGLMNVDFSAAGIQALKSTTENKYACPSVGDVNVLVLPICFKSDSEETRAKIDPLELGALLNGEGGVSEFFAESSFGKLNMHFDVYPKLFESAYSPEEEYMDSSSVNSILLSALTAIESEIDLSKYDSDGDGSIDSVLMVNTLDKSEYNLVQWAFKSTNFLTSSAGDKYLFDGLGVSNYVWLASDFLYDDAGEPTVKTVVHEITHTMGVPDYYATDYYLADDPVYGQDLMSDAMMDHSPFTKFALGWITEATLVTDPTNAEIALTNFWETGEALIVANDFDPSLGCFQEYFILMYSVGEPGFRDGLVVYHVDASLYKKQVFNQVEVSLYNDNDFYPTGGSEDNLIEIVKIDGELSTALTTGNTCDIVLRDNKNLSLSLQISIPWKNGERVFLRFE